MRFVWCLLCGLLVLTLVPGCGRPSELNIERDVEVESLGNKSLTFPAPRQDQDVNVLVRTSGVEIAVYLVLEKDREAVMNQLEDGKAVTGNVLAKKEKMKEGTLEAKIPAGSEYALIMSNASNKPVSVSIKVAAKKQ